MKLSPMVRNAGLFGLLICASSAGLAAESTPQSKALDALLDQQWQWQLKESPEQASTIGDYRYNDRWTDYSLGHVPALKAANERFLAQFKALDTHGLSEQEQLSLKMMIRELQDNLEAIRLKNYEMPLDQIEGVQIGLPGEISSFPFNTTQQYEDYLKRLQAVPKVVDDLIAVSRQGLADHLIQPKYLLEKVAKQCAQIASPAGVDNVFGQPVAQFPAGVSAADQTRLRQQILAAVDQQVRPAYRKLADFVAKDYAPYGRTEEGIWALPDGDARYRFAIHSQTTTDMSPAQIHQLGLNEVARIEGEMLKIAHQLGYKDLASFQAALVKDKKQYATSREQILDAYRGYIAGMLPELPKLFGHIPSTKLEVRPVEAYREKEAPDAEYHQGTPDGSRPGAVYVNTGDFSERVLYPIEDTSYHEGVPGHHMQISIAQSLPLPPFRQQGAYNAYIEGWALYSEQLGKEMGFYKNPYNDYGRLEGDLLRADRLVLDTGVHYLHWNRAQMIAFFRAHPAEDEPGMQAETDRYVAWPGQALGYKLGELKFFELRKRAQQELGSKFDIRAFHDEMLSGGAMPLDLLDARTNAWIAAVKAGQPADRP